MIYKGRAGEIDPYKARFALETNARTLADALVGADVFVGLSVAGAMTRRDGRSRWRPKPIIFALANPVPEILPDEVRAVRDDAIIATGRSDYPNQVNNVLGFPFIFRGALDVRATRDQRGDEDGGDARARARSPRKTCRTASRRSTACTTCSSAPSI